MKKFIFGVLFGLLLSMPATVFADDIKSMIGKAVDGVFPVFVDGKQLDTKAIVIEGTSYAPVRAIGEAIGKNIGFDGTKITLDSVITKMEVNPMTNTDTFDSTAGVTNEQKIKNLESKINDTRVDIEIAKKALGLGVQNGIDYEQKTKDLQSKLQQLQQQKDALEAAQ